MAEIASRKEESAKENRLDRTFIRLRDEWKRARRHESSTQRMVMLMPYQRIIGLGPDVVPLILRELEQQPDMWFWALRALTEADPVTEDMRGDVQAMARLWLEWGKAQGYQW